MVSKKKKCKDAIRDSEGKCDTLHDNCCEGFAILLIMSSTIDKLHGIFQIIKCNVCIYSIYYGMWKISIQPSLLGEISGMTLNKFMSEISAAAAKGQNHTKAQRDVSATLHVKPILCCMAVFVAEN